MDTSGKIINPKLIKGALKKQIGRFKLYELVHNIPGHPLHRKPNGKLWVTLLLPTGEEGYVHTIAAYDAENVVSFACAIKPRIDGTERLYTRLKKILDQHPEDIATKKVVEQAISYYVPVKSAFKGLEEQSEKIPDIPLKR
jgi:hypothetical protein